MEAVTTTPDPMASQFIGANVILTLNDPLELKVHGKIAEIVGQRLLLHDVFFPGTAGRMPSMTIQGAQIMDLEVAPMEKSHSGSSSRPLGQQKQQLIDPAIVSMGQASTGRPPSVQAPSSIPEKSRETTPPPIVTQAELDGSKAYTGKRSRRGGRGKAQKAAAEEELANPAQHFEVWESPSAALTPQASVPTGLSKPKSSKSRRQRAHYPDDQDGWATEEITDIAGMGEFDFVGNLSKFDKRTVFDQIKAEDTTVEGTRLVHHNRIQPRPGTAGGKNLHFTENVLESSNPRNTFQSDADDSEQPNDGRAANGSGRGSKRGTSRHTSRSAPSRQGSGTGPTVSHVTANLHRQTLRPSHDNTRPGSIQLVQSGRHCPAVSPLRLMDVERTAEVEFGISEAITSEHAARGIAEISVSILSNQFQPGSSPFVIILAGNNKTGSRAITAGRLLLNKGVRVVTTVLGLEREDELIESVRSQLTVLRRSGGRVHAWPDLEDKLQGLEHSSPDLVIDGLLGMHIGFDDLRTSDATMALSMVRWANLLPAARLSVDIPFGFDATAGTVAYVDTVPLVLEATHVVALGAPLTGLLQAMILAASCITSSSSSSSSTSPLSSAVAAAAAAAAAARPALVPLSTLNWKLFIADISVGSAAWRRCGTRRRSGVDFGHEWIVEADFSGRDN